MLMMAETLPSGGDIEMVPATDDNGDKEDEDMGVSQQVPEVADQNKLYSVIVRLPENLSADVLIDERYHHVFQYAKLKRAHKGVRFSSWLARTRSNSFDSFYSPLIILTTWIQDRYGSTARR
jgi:hypothetical protein